MRPRPSPLIELFSLNDQELARLAQRDGAAFAELFHRHLRPVYRYLAAVSGSYAEAQELTSQTFIAALEGIRAYRGDPSVSSWLLGLASEQAVLHMRLRQIEAPPKPAPPPQPSAGARLGLEQVSRALARLEPERAEAVRLYLFAGLSAAETAQVLKKSPAAAKTLLLHCLRDLLKVLPPRQAARP